MAVSFAGIVELVPSLMSIGQVADDAVDNGRIAIGDQTAFERALPWAISVFVGLSHLAQSARNRCEGRLQLGAKRLHDRDDGYCNTGGDQPILDGRGTRFVGPKAPKCFHCRLVISAGRT